jgi:hypothetical protein
MKFLVFFALSLREEKEGKFTSLGMIAAELRQQGMAIHNRHGDVADHEVRFLVEDRIEGDLAVFGLQRLVAGIMQLFDDIPAQIDFIFNTENGRGHLFGLCK